MGDVLDALTSRSGIAPIFVAEIEGCPYLLTDGDPAKVVTAWSGSGWTQALGGLEADVRHDQRLQPWEPFKTSSSSAQLSVMDVSGTNADTFGLLVFKREGMNATRLTADVQPDDTTINVQSTSAFASSGTIYLGNEAIAYSGKTATSFTGCTRGKWSPFVMESGDGFARTHRAVLTVPGIDPAASPHATVADAPIDWKGRWVAVRMVRDLGGVYDTRAQSHLLFAGRIASIRDAADARTVVYVDDLREGIGEAVILREQFTAKVVPTVTLFAGVTFGVSNSRGTTAAEADALTVVASGATAPNEINAGSYTAAEIADAINAWLASETDAGNLLFSMTFSAAVDSADGTRSSVRYADSDGTLAARTLVLRTNNAIAARFFGWNSDNEIASGTVTSATGTVYSAREPQQVSFTGLGTNVTLRVEQAQGEYIDQSVLFLPNGFAGTTGVVRIGTALYLCKTPSITNGAGTIEIIAAAINTAVGADPAEATSLSVDADGFVTLEQVLFLSGTIKKLALALLASTGSGDNWTGYDLLPAQASAAVPYALMGTAFEAELAAMAAADDEMTIIVDRPTRLLDLLDKSFVFRLVQFGWRQGRLALAGWRTPTDAATITIAADDRARPVDTDDDLVAVTEERDDLLRNIVKIRHGADAFGENFRDTTTLVDPGSAGNYGARAITLDARNATRGVGIAGEDIDGPLLARFAAGLTFLSRPALTVRVPIDLNLLETATAGQVCLFSDGFARDPATGRRGITGKPALIVANRFSWGDATTPPTGEVDLVLFPRLSLAPFCPCAQVVSYNAGTKVLTCAAHEHSRASDTTHDAARFAAGDKVRVVELDPSDPNDPLTWTDTVASQTGDTITLTTGLAGYDAGKTYRVISNGYSTAVTTQRANAYQADDADGRVADLRDPYGLTWSPLGQVESYEDADPSTELPCRVPALAYGDGAPLDTGHARDLARGINSLISYHGPQQPSQVTASTNIGVGGSGWQVVHVEMVHLGIGVSTVDRTRKLYVGPTVSRASGSDPVSIRVTLAQRMPRTGDPTAPGRYGVTRVAPYTEHTFTTTSATRETKAAVGLDTSHLSSGHNHFAGLGILYVEISENATFHGFGTQYVGPLEAP